MADTHMLQHIRNQAYELLDIIDWGDNTSTRLKDHLVRLLTVVTWKSVEVREDPAKVKRFVLDHLLPEYNTDPEVTFSYNSGGFRIEMDLVATPKSVDRSVAADRLRQVLGRDDWARIANGYLEEYNKWVLEEPTSNLPPKAGTTKRGKG